MAMFVNCLPHLTVNNDLPSVIDLFSGCGGLSYGFLSAGFPLEAGIDSCEAAVQTASYNLAWRHGKQSGQICGDVTAATPEMFSGGLDKNGCIVIGGPPCQAYSQIGKGKLRSLGEDRSHLRDERGQLYKYFLRMALELDARAVVMENVPEAVNYGNANIPEAVCDTLEKNGYKAIWSILNAADYGVPQTRERLFVVAIKKNEGIEPELPMPTHRSVDGSAGIYKQRFPRLAQHPHFVFPPESDKELKPWVTVGEALSDLPELFPSSDSRYRLYELNVLLKYATAPKNEYQKLMRNWGGQTSEYVTGHGYRNTARDFRIFERMKHDDNYPDAVRIAEELLEEACLLEGVDPVANPKAYQKLRRKIVPPYDPNKFHDKWKKLHPGKPSHTLVAHLGVDTYSHIHPWEPRGISVREAARLQSFPDGFLFQCNMGDAFRQIGNAVPPLLSFAIAKRLAEIFNGG